MLVSGRVIFKSALDNSPPHISTDSKNGDVFLLLVFLSPDRNAETWKTKTKFGQWKFPVLVKGGR